MSEKKSATNLLTQLRQYFPQLKEKYHINTLELFGSYVRGEQTESSDLDILVSFHETPSLLTFVALEGELADLLNLEVDLVMKDSLKPALENRILQEAIAL